MSIPVLLDAIVVDASNNALSINEAASTFTATITPGTYYLRGDGTASDLCAALATALSDASAGGNAYGVTVAFNGDPAAPTAVVTVTRTVGASTFRLLWAAVLTTMSPLSFGFAVVNTALDSAAKVSALSPSSCWVSNCAPQDSQPKRSATTYGFVTNGGRFAGGLVGGPFVEWRLGFAFVDGRRFDSSYIDADPTRALSAWWGRALRGGASEYHLVDFASPASQLLGAASAATRIGGAWHLHEDSASDFDGSRYDRATSLWSLDTLLRAQVL